MPLDIELEPGEEMILDETLPAADPGDVQFSVAVSDRALFLPRKKRFAVADPWYFDKVPLARIRRVVVAPHRPAWLWLLSWLMVLGGFGGLYLAREGGDPVRYGQLIGYSLAIVAVGFALPWALRAHLRLRIEMTRGRFSWAPRLTIGGTYGEDARRFLFRFGEACRRAGLEVRAPASGPGSSEPGERPAAAAGGGAKAEPVARPWARWRRRSAIGLVLYGAFVALCFTMEIEGRARFQVPSEADVEAIDDRVQRIRTEAARGRALAAMRDWPPYAAYAIGIDVLFFLGLAVGCVLAFLGVRAVWRVPLARGFAAPIMIFVILLVLSAVLSVLGGPPHLAQRYVEGERSVGSADWQSTDPL